MVQLAVDPISEERFEGAYHEGAEDCVLSIRGRGPSIIAKDGVVGSSRNDDDVLPTGLCARLGTGVVRLDLEIQTPSISTPLSSARIPKGASVLCPSLASIIAGVGSSSRSSIVE